jgi:tetratricopeptide (TPR) repeat protein
MCLFWTKHLARYLLHFLLGAISAAAAAQPQPDCHARIFRGIDSMYQQNYRAAIQLLSDARDEAQKNGWYEQRFLAANNLGLTFFQLNDLGTALQHYLEAYALALEHRQASDEMTVLNNLAVAYSSEKNYEKAGEFFQKAYETAKKLQNTAKTGYYATNLGWLALDKKDPRQAERHFLEALPLLENSPRMRLYAHMGLAQVAAHSGQLEKALAAFDTLLAAAERADFRREKNELLEALAKSYADAGKPDLAIHFARRLRRESPDLDRQRNAFGILAAAFQKKNAWMDCLAAKDSVLILTDSLHRTQNRRLFEHHKLRFELQQSQADLALQRTRNEGQRRAFAAFGLLGLAVAALALWALRKRAQDARQQQIMAENELKIRNLELEKQHAERQMLESRMQEAETAARLEQERLRNEVELRNRQLAARVLAQSSRNELIAGIASSLAQTPDLPTDSPLARHVRELKKHLSADADWTDFQRAFEELNPRFTAALLARHPDLTPGDLRFLSLLLMNLGTKEIASLLHVTPEACRKRKERICQKLGIASGENLHGYLAEFA